MCGRRFSSQCADPAFGESVRAGCADRGLEDFPVLGAEGLTEGVDELAARSRPSEAKA